MIGGGGLLYVYIGCLAFGGIYAVISALLGAHGFDHSGFDHGGMDGHGGADNADVPTPFNPLVIASAIAGFGATGVIGKAGFGMGNISSALVALAFAAAVGALIFFGVVKLMYGSQSNSTFSMEQLPGIEAQVITPISPKGLGEIVYVMNGMRYNMTAKSAHDDDIMRGETVRIKAVSGNVALVTRVVSLDDIHFFAVEHTEEENPGPNSRDAKGKNENKNL